jgi:FtsP/CotA-like multicopper oxidase with cupredoxin domain
MHIVVVFSVLLSIVNSQTVLVDLAWKPTTTKTQYPGYDFVGKLELCKRIIDGDTGTYYGYRDATVADSVCSTPGPSIRMKPGAKYLMYLSNTAGVNTNLHTHGIHVSGDGNADNVMRMLPSGQCLGYNFTIPEDHNAGTYWYHAHLHKLTRPQVGGGAYGYLFIEDTKKDGTYVNDFPKDVISNPGFQSFLKNERTVFFAMHDPPTPNANGKPDTIRVLEVPLIENQWTRLRIAVAIPLGQSSSIYIPAPCEARLLGMDGMWISSLPAPPADTFSLANAERAEIAIKCPSSVQMVWKTTVRNLNVDIKVSPNYGVPSEDTPFGPGGEGSTWSPIRPHDMESCLDGPVYKSHTVQGAVDGIIWDGVSKTINVEPFDPPKLEYEKIYQFIIQHPQVPDGRLHPIHLHVYPQQIIGRWENGAIVEGDCAGSNNNLPYKRGEFYDTILSPDSCVYRFRTRGMGGQVMLHCHMLAHEDGGAMIWVQVDGGPDSAAKENPPVEPIPCPENIN